MRASTPLATDVECVEQKHEEVKGAGDGSRGKHDTARVVGCGFGGWLWAAASVRFCPRESRQTMDPCGGRGSGPFLTVSIYLAPRALAVFLYFSVLLVLLASSGVIVVTVFMEYGTKKAQSISLRFI